MESIARNKKGFVGKRFKLFTTRFHKHNYTNEYLQRDKYLRILYLPTHDIVL